MHELLDFLVQNGYWLLFLWILAEQLGLPLPSAPLLLLAGALAGMGRMNAGSVLLLTFLACLVADLLWYELGRRRGNQVLSWLCQIALEPDSCVRRSENLFSRYGSRALLFAKFLPGINAMAAPVAGIIRMRAWRFLIFDSIGIGLWSGSFLVLGLLFRNQVELLALYSARFGGMLFWLAVTALGAYVARKYAERRRFLREIAVARIPAEELKQRLDSGEEVTIVDLRHPLDFLPYPQTIGNAIRMSPDEVEARHQEIPRDREVVLYCT